MSAPLDRHQKGVICQVARLAFDAQGLGESAEFAVWRHEQTAQACGKESLRACTQDDFAAVLARFLDLAGESGAAFRWYLRGLNNPKRVARFKLDEALAERGLAAGYAEAIARRQFKCSVDDLTERQTWNLVYTVRNRRKAVSPDRIGVSSQRSAVSGGGQAE